MDQVRNEVVRRRTGVMRESADEAEQSVLMWFGHMLRMEEDWLVKRIVGSNVGWMDSVKIALNEIGMSVD